MASKGVVKIPNSSVTLTSLEKLILKVRKVQLIIVLICITIIDMCLQHGSDLQRLPEKNRIEENRGRCGDAFIKCMSESQL